MTSSHAEEAHPWPLRDVQPARGESPQPTTSEKLERSKYCVCRLRSIFGQISWQGSQEGREALLVSACGAGLAAVGKSESLRLTSISVAPPSVMFRRTTLVVNERAAVVAVGRRAILRTGLADTLPVVCALSIARGAQRNSDEVADSSSFISTESRIPPTPRSCLEARVYSVRMTALLTF